VTFPSPGDESWSVDGEVAVQVVDESQYEPGLKNLTESYGPGKVKGSEHCWLVWDPGRQERIKLCLDKGYGKSTMSMWRGLNSRSIAVTFLDAF
jgi:hypothetical protein